MHPVLNRLAQPAVQTARRSSLQKMAALLCFAGASPAYALQARSLGMVPGAALNTSAAPSVQFNQSQSRIVRAWIARIIHTQLAQSPSPRWQQRDCAGLVRFAVAESLREHDANWRRANGLLGQALPPDVQLTAQQGDLRHRWRLVDGSRAAYVGALEMVQENTVFVSKSWNNAQLADLFLFDQGDEQHLMVWMGRYLAYHTGSSTKTDHGLRAVPLKKLLSWQDTRWQPVPSNPNFAGVFRLSFLSSI